MEKKYPYGDVKVKVADNTDVTFEVQFLSDGNTGFTYVTVQNVADFEIDDAGSTVIGKAKDLRDKVISIGSQIGNLADEEDQININFLINDKVVVEHSNPKSESDQPRISFKLILTK